MKQQLTLFIIILIGLCTIATSSFAATNQSLNVAENINPQDPIENSQEQGFFQKRITKKIKKWIEKWEEKSTKTKEKDDDEIGVWTWVSLGLVAGSLLFPPLIFGGLITSIIALRKNRRDDNLGETDRVLAITSLIIAIIGSVVIAFVIALYGLILLAAFSGI